MQPAMPEHLYQFRQHDNGIYEFIFLDSSQATVDAWISRVESITALCEPSDTVRFLIDSTKAVLPVGYSLLRAQQYVRSNPARPYTRTGVLYNVKSPLAMTSILNIFLHWLHGSAREKLFFAPDGQRDQAIEWLLRDD